jgi:hypothetical protein
MEIDELLSNVVPVRPEHAAKMRGCTHTCRHVPAVLDNGKRIMLYRVRFALDHAKTIQAAMCRECLLRVPCESEVSRN